MRNNLSKQKFSPSPRSIKIPLETTKPAFCPSVGGMEVQARARARQREREIHRESTSKRDSQLQTYINRLPKTALDRNRQRGSRQTDRETDRNGDDRKKDRDTDKENVKQTETGR